MSQSENPSGTWMVPQAYGRFQSCVAIVSMIEHTLSLYNSENPIGIHWVKLCTAKIILGKF